MIHHILVRAGLRSHLGGNIGGSLLTDLNRIHADDWIVLELSSAMLHWLGAGAGCERACGWSPHVAVLTNLTPNHLDWHGSVTHYRQSKLNIFAHQDRGDLRVTAEEIDRHATTVPLMVPGNHNQLNAQMARAAARQAIGMDPDVAAASLGDFPGLPHRLQLIAHVDGMRFYNDSKATTPEATLLAVRSFDDPSSIHLIAGGYDKGSDLKPITELAGRIAGLYTIGKTGHGIADGASEGFAEYCGTLDAAVGRARGRMRPGHVLLLSPGCASWDQFTNYEARGNEFTRLVHANESGSGRHVCAAAV
jgi:UDP-N-acetylmuramoylalanine--D-glutamate ligase